MIVPKEVPRKAVAGLQQETQREIKFAVHGGAFTAFAKSSYRHVVSRLFKCLSLFAISRNAALHYIYTQKQAAVNHLTMTGQYPWTDFVYGLGVYYGHYRKSERQRGESFRILM